MLRRITREEAGRPANGQYLYAHAVLPHGPEVMDGRCEYIGAPPLKRTAQQHKQAYLIHAECAVRLVVDFLQRLKKLGRYDPATIVLHADTGHWTAFEPEQPSDAPAPTTLDRRLNSRRLLSEVHSLLMIKRPHATGPLRILDTPTQLVDLYPTLLEMLDRAAELCPARALGVRAGRDCTARGALRLRPEQTPRAQCHRVSDRRSE